MKANKATEKAVMAVLEKLTDSYEKRDIDAPTAILPPDDGLFMFGTGIDEKRTGRDAFRFQAERDWSQTDALAFNFTWYRISAAGPVACVAAEGLGQGQAGAQEIQFPMRLTAVLEQRGDTWYLVQSHFSVPAAGQEEGDSVPL